MYKTKRPVTTNYQKYLDRKRTAALKEYEIETYYEDDARFFFEMQFPFWSASVIEIDAWCKEATVFRKDGRTVFTTGVFSDTATGLTQKNWFLLGSNHPEKMVRFLGCTYQHIMDYYLSKYGTLWASALRDAKEPNRLLEKGSFVFQREFEYNGTGYNLYVLGRDV